MNLIKERDGEIIVREAKTWIGTPHINGHKQKDIGVDCARLLEAALESAGYLKENCLKITGDYVDDWYLYSNNENILLKILEKVATRISTGKFELQPGDIFCFKLGRQIGHIAIYEGAGRLIHSMHGFGVVETTGNDDFFFDKRGRSRLEALYRLDLDKLEEVNK